MSNQRFRIGCALPPKKVDSFLKPSLVEHAKQHDVDLVEIDPSKSLLSQGPFDCLVHKLYGDEWAKRLAEFSATFPSVPIIDPPQFIERLDNRASMLGVLTDLTAPREFGVSCGVPEQVVVSDEISLAALRDSASELRFPAVAKPLVAHGSDGAHQMYLIFNRDGLSKVSLPVVLQEFVNHGGVLFKVYVAGKHVQCVKRRSLPDVTAAKLASSTDSALPFSRISNTAGVEDDERLSAGKETQMPPREFVEALARELRERMKLNLFNLDLIRDAGDENRYLVIDINYFPGYAKTPNYEPILTEFFRSVAREAKIGVASVSAAPVLDVDGKGSAEEEIPLGETKATDLTNDMNWAG